MRESSSPVIVALQYLSYLAAGKAPRLALMFLALGYTSWSEFRDKEPELVETFRVGILMTASSIERRLGMKMRSWPWLVAHVADENRSPEERRAFAEEGRNKSQSAVLAT